MKKRPSVNARRIAEAFDIRQLREKVKTELTRQADEDGALIECLGSSAAGIYQTREICADFGVVFPRNIPHSEIYEDAVEGKVISVEFWCEFAERYFDKAAEILTRRVNIEGVKLYFNFLDADGSFCLFARKDDDDEQE